MNASILVSLAALPLLAYFLSGFLFYRIAVARSKKEFLSNDPSLPDSVKEKDESLGQWWEAQEKREERILSKDGLELVADYLPGGKPSKLAFILLHGYSGTGQTMKRFARLFRERFDCDILTPDLRGHGRSEGAYIGFGLPDSKDLLLWVDRMISLRGSDVKIVLFGISMGGATVLMSAGANPPANVVCAISDCGYSNTRDILAYKIRKLYGLPPFPIVNAVITVTRMMAGFNINEASPRAAVKRSLIPLLFIHGDADDFVPVAMARELHDAAACEKKMLIIPGAGHAESCKAGGKTYADLVQGFVRSAMDKARL